MSSNYQLILASNSPRRKELMNSMGFEFETFTLEIEETYPSAIEIKEVAKYLAEKKNKVYRNHFKDEVVVTADTTVIFDGHILEKPINASHAYEMINSLSAQSHSVLTGVSISSGQKTLSFEEETIVTFKNLSDNEITRYVEKYRPFDKAGAYGIQEWIGLIGVDQIEGSFFNVMGLPTHLAYQSLTEQFGVWPK